MATHGKKDVLIVDDDPSIRNLLCVAMKRIGLSCGTAEDGLDALEHLRTDSYSVVLTDLMMPRLDGAGFIKELKELERVSKDRPVILIMTAFGVEEPIPVIRELVQAVIRKPFDVTELAELVRGCVETRQALDAKTAGSL